MAQSFKLSSSEGTKHPSTTSNNVINLSNFTLSSDEINILNRGLTFVPTPNVSLDPIVESIETFSRHLKLKNFFSKLPNLGTHTRSQFTDRSTWTPPDSKIDDDVLKCIDSITEDIKTLTIQKEDKNLSKNEFQAINNLKRNSEIVIKKADKGSAVVIMDKCNYVSEGLRQLNNPSHYRQISTPLYLDNAKKISKIVENLHDSGHLSTKEFKFLIPPHKPRQRRFYMLPKIHKDNNLWPIPGVMPPGRPIVSDCNSESEKIAMYIDSYIKPRSNKHPSYIKNTYDFLDKVLDTKLSSHSLLITLDVESMYTNINHDEGLKAVKNAFSDLAHDSKFIAIMELLELSLKGNDFEFDNKLFLQISGTAMGQKYAPHYADIYMAEFEKEALAKCELQPTCYYRYLDDIFIIWPHGLDAFNTFLNTFNTHRSSIKFKAEISSDSVNFLDTTLFRGSDNTLQSKVFFKPTDTHQLLHKSSFHPKHTFAGLVKSQITRFFNICSNPLDVESACQVLFKALAKRNYPKRWLRKLKNETLRNLNRNERPGAPITMPTTSVSGCSPCMKTRCLTCDIVPNCHNFSGSVFNQTYSINAKLDCDSKNLIYLYTCKLCDKQYVGETGNSLRTRNNQHRTAINCGNTEDALYSHLLNFHKNIQYSIDHYSLTAIEKLPDSENPVTVTLDKVARLKREYCWIDTLCTFEPHGLNVQKFEKFSLEHTRKHNFDLFYIVPFSKTGNASAQIVKKHMKTLNKKMDSNIKIAVAYKKHQNLKNKLVRSKLPSHS